MSRNYSLGMTPRLAQSALADEMRKLFEGKKYAGQEGRKELNVFEQDTPIPQGDDDDVDTDRANAPYVVVQMDGGAVNTPDNPQMVDFTLVICAFDRGADRQGYQDVANIKEDIVQRFCTAPYFGGAYTIQYPITWAMQMDDTYPYYYGAVLLKCTTPAMTCDTEMEELV